MTAFSLATSNGSAPESAKVRGNAVLAVVVAFLIALFISSFPWQDLLGAEFGDRQVYLEHFAEPYISPTCSPIQVCISQEIFWPALSKFLTEQLGNAERAFFFLTFACSFVCARFAITESGRASSGLLLLNPWFVDLVQSQIRIAVALAIVLAFWRTKNNYVLLAIFVVATLVHAAAPLIWICYVLSRQYRRDGTTISGSSRLVRLVSAVVIVLFLIGPFRNDVLAALGDRRIDYRLVGTSITIAIAWAFILAPLFVRLGNPTVTRANTMLCSLGAIYVIGAAMGLPTLRFLSLAMPFLAASIYDVRGLQRATVMVAVLAVSATQFTIWVLT